MALRRAASSNDAAVLFGSAEARLALLRAVWPHAVGAEIARRTRVLAVDGAVLRVQIPDARWRKVLHRLQPTILGRIARVVGETAPRRIGFIELPPEDDRCGIEAPVAPARDLGPASDAVVRGAAAIADPELRQSFVEAATRYLARARGHDRPS